MRTKWLATGAFWGVFLIVMAAAHYGRGTRALDLATIGIEAATAAALSVWVVARGAYPRWLSDFVVDRRPRPRFTLRG